MTGISHVTSSGETPGQNAAAQERRQHGTEQRNDDLQRGKVLDDIETHHSWASRAKISSSSMVP